MNNTKRNYIRIYFKYLVASLIIGVPFALLNGVWPKSITGWIIVFILGMPTMILLEFIGEKLFSEKISQSIDKDKKDKIISLRRMAYTLIIGILWIMVIVILGYFLQKYGGAHFKIY